jgi:hypothetical protein
MDGTMLYRAYLREEQLREVAPQRFLTPLFMVGIPWRTIKFRSGM